MTQLLKKPYHIKRIKLINIVKKYDVLYRRDKIWQRKEKKKAWHKVFLEYSEIDEKASTEYCKKTWDSIRTYFVGTLSNKSSKEYLYTPYLQHILPEIKSIYLPIKEENGKQEPTASTSKIEKSNENDMMTSTSSKILAPIIHEYDKFLEEMTKKYIEEINNHTKKLFEQCCNDINNHVKATLEKFVKELNLNPIVNVEPISIDKSSSVTPSRETSTDALESGTIADNRNEYCSSYTSPTPEKLTVEDSSQNNDFPVRGFSSIVPYKSLMKRYSTPERSNYGRHKSSNEYRTERYRRKVRWSSPCRNYNTRRRSRSPSTRQPKPQIGTQSSYRRFSVQERCLQYRPQKRYRRYPSPTGHWY
ncbi:CLUMA_CG013933, isoform A [Clunio marinus]|uniref:CLUMA_CG013933, isoform A n=1 Tax=Clunio marinus TaxID=568069 RepID=A0A1J1IQ94_9DIPT|nr:CLUMA_CG013933, isoform A [Clunio marinus]